MPEVPVFDPQELLHEVAFVEDQVRIELFPDCILVGLATKETVGFMACDATVIFAEAVAGVVPVAPIQVML